MKTLPVFLCLIILIILGCSTPPLKEIKIGADFPLTGDIASYGKKAQDGINLALDEVNNSKENNFKLIVDFQDNKGKTGEAATIMNKFCSIDKYSVVIGGASSSESIIMIPIANKNKVVQISPISSSSDLSINDYFFRVCPSDAYQAIIMANWLIELKLDTVGLLVVNNSWGNSLKNEFIGSYNSLGGVIATTESLNDGDRDFKTQISKIISTKPNAIYCISYGAEGGIILKQLKELGFTKKIFGADVWSSPELISSGKDAAEGVYLIKPAEHSNDKYNKFREKYFAKYREEPDVYAAYSYDIIMILINAYTNNAITGDQIKNYLLNMQEYSGVTGPTKFDANGDCNTKPFIKQLIKNGEYQNIN